MVNLKDLDKRLKRLEERVLPEIEEEEREKERKHAEYMANDIPIDEALKIKEVLDECKEYTDWSIGTPHAALSARQDCKTLGFKDDDFDQLADQKLIRKTLGIWKKLFNEKELRRLQDKLGDCETVSEVKSILPPKIKSSLRSGLKKYRVEVRKIVKNRSKKR